MLDSEDMDKLLMGETVKIKQKNGQYLYFVYSDEDKRYYVGDRVEYDIPDKGNRPTIMPKKK